MIGSKHPAAVWPSAIPVLIAVAFSAPLARASRCDTLRAQHPEILFCEDFENPAYNRAGPLDAAHAWHARFGGATPGKNCEGPSGTCIVDVVAPGQCNAAGESGRSCVFDGAQSLGFPYREGSDGGNLGEFKFSTPPLRTFGATFAMRLSSGLAFTGPAKFDRFFGPQRGVDGTVHELLGENTDEGYAARGPLGALGDIRANRARATPFQATWDEDTCSTAKSGLPCIDLTRAIVRAGQWGENDVHQVAQPAPGWAYPRGRWACVQLKVAGWGTSDARLRWAVDGQVLIDLEHVDLSRARGLDKQGINGLRFENYTNQAYVGQAYRYEDNWVVTSGEPISCVEVGFEAPLQTCTP